VLSPQQSTHSLQWINQSTIRRNFLLSLGSEYDSLVILVHQRVAPPSIDELYGHLLSHELRLEQQTSTPNLSLAGANVAVKSNFFRGGRGNGGRSSNFSNSGCGNSIAGNKKSFSQSPNRGRGRGRGPSSGTQLVCQSVLALHCYHRFDNSYYSEQSATMEAYYNTNTVVSDPNWYTDTGATHHLTSDLANLNVHVEDYPGSDQIRVGNSEGLLVAHIGKTKLSTPQ
jgi:hypothetical protein